MSDPYNLIRCTKPFLSQQSFSSAIRCPSRISLRENEVCFASLKQTNLQVKNQELRCAQEDYLMDFSYELNSRRLTEISSPIQPYSLYRNLSCHARRRRAVFPAKRRNKEQISQNIQTLIQETSRPNIKLLPKKLENRKPWWMFLR